MQDQDRREYTATFREMQDKYHHLNTKYNSADEARVFTLFVIFQGIQTSIAKKPYSFVIFQRGGPDPLSPPPSRSAHVYVGSSRSCVSNYDISSYDQIFEY